MTQLTEIFSLWDLNSMIMGGFVRKQVHPDAPYSILNYTEKAAWENVWNEVTLQCRGLIFNHDTMEVIARPFKKFMNYGQTGAATIKLDERVIVTDKMDGSLGILYRLPSGSLAVATRGSFASDQALHATEILQRKYAGFVAPRYHTMLFEIVFRQNRIVLDYGDMDDLVLLGSVNILTGTSHDAKDTAEWTGWKGPVTQTFSYRTLAEALAAPARSNAEGLVVHSVDSDERIKLKQEDYIALHRIVTNLSERAVWEQIIAGKTNEEIIAPLPDEFHNWTRDVCVRLSNDVFEAEMDVREAYNLILHNLNIKYGYVQWGRKEFALEVKDRSDKWAMFMLMDHQQERLLKELWKRAKPEAFRTPSGVVHNEDTA